MTGTVLSLTLALIGLVKRLGSAFGSGAGSGFGLG
jgi:hypothetical protein